MTDHGRRERIIDATLDVIIERGISGLSHRRVAQKAGVPLSATNYYFGTLHELIEAAFTEAIDRDRSRFLKDMEQIPPETSAVDTVAMLSYHILEDGSSDVVALELCVAGLRNKRLKAIARGWDDGWREMMTPRLGARRARLASVVMAGIMIRGVLSDELMPLDEITEIVRDSFDADPETIAFE